MARTHQRPPFEIRDSGIQGRGAFATRRIRKGTWIVEYVGPRITLEAADRIYDDTSTHTFLFTVDEHTVIDATERGNDARFINHSCAPNCDAWNADGEIWIVSARDIEAGEELSYDYGLPWEGENDEVAFSRYACRCGAQSCRGTLLRREPGAGSRTMGGPTPDAVA